MLCARPALTTLAKEESSGTLRGTLITSLYSKQTKRQAGAFIVLLNPLKKITHCMRVVNVIFLSPPTYCTHLVSCSSASLC